VLYLTALIVWATLTPGGRTTTKSLLLLPNLIPNAPIRPINWVTRTPDQTVVSFTDGEESWMADVYIPATEGPHPAIIVSLGVTPGGSEDDRIRRLGDGLARMGTVVLIPYSDNLNEKRVTLQEVDLLVAAFGHLEQRPDVDPGRIGFLSVCVGSSLALLAAQDARINDQVEFVNWFGGYYNLENLIASVATGSFEEDGRPVPWEVDRLTKEVVRLRTIDLVDDAAERELLTLNIIHHQELTQEDLAGLSPTGAVVQRLFEMTELNDARRLIEEFPDEALATLRALSPEGNLDGIRARVFLMDDNRDQLIPYTHTRALAEALDGNYVRHSKFSIFTHADLDDLANPVKSAPQLWNLFRHIDSIFRGVL
jgi:dienelactone hydrolase